MVEQIGLEAVLDTSNFNKGLRTYLDGIGAAGRKTTSTAGLFGQSFVAMGNSVLGFGAIASKALITGAASVAAGLATVGVLSTKTAIEFEAAWAGVVKTTDGLVDEFGNLTAAGQAVQDSMRDLAKDTGLAVEELLGIGELGGQLGVARDDLFEFTEAVAALGVSTNLTTEAAAAGFAQLANIMGTVEREGADAFSKLGSAIVALGNNSATTEAEILAFAQRIAGAGAIAGLTEADILGIGAAFASVGVEADAGGTAVQKVLLAMTTAVQGSSREALPEWQAALSQIQETADVSLQEVADAVHEGGDALEDLAKRAGVSAETITTALNLGMGAPGSQILRDFADVAGLTAEEFKTMFEEDATGAFQLFVDGLGEAGDEAITILEELGLSDQRLVRAFLSLAGAGDVLNDSLELSSLAWEDNTALTNEANQRYQTAEFRIKQFKNTIKDAGITIGTAILPALGDMLEIIQPIIEQFGQALPGFLEQNVIPALMTFVTWIGTNLPIALQMASDFWTNTLQPALVTFWSFLQTNIFPLITQLVSWFQDALPQAIAFVTEHWDEFKGALIAIGAVLAAGGIISAIAGIIAALNPVTLAIGAIVAAAAFLGAAWAGNWGGIRDVLTQVWTETLQPALVELQLWLAENLPIAIAALSDFWTNTLQPALATVWEFITTTLIPAFATIVAWLADNIPVAIQAASDFWQNTLKPALETVWTFITEDLVPAIEAVVEWLEVNIPAAIETASDFWENTLKPALEAVWGFIEEFIIPIFESIVNLFDVTLSKSLEGLAQLWTDTLQPALEDVWAFIEENVLPIFEEISDFISGTAGDVINTFVENSLGPLAEGLELVKIWLEKVKSWIDKLAAAVAAFSWGEVDKAIPESPPPLVVGLQASAAAFQDLQEVIRRGFDVKVDPFLSALLEGQVNPLDDLIAAAGKLGGFLGGFLGFGRRQSEGVLQGLQDELASIEALAGNATIESLSQEKQQRRLELLRMIADEEQKITEQERQALELQKQQEQLGFLKEQMNLLAFIREQGLDPAELLGDIQFGLDASIPDLVAATSKAMQAAIEAANQELMGDGLGSIAQPGLPPGFQVGAPGAPVQPLPRETIHQTANVNFGGVNVSGDMDLARFEAIIRRIIREEFAGAG